MPSKEIYTLIGIAIAVSTGGNFGAVFKTPTGADITVDFETAAELNLKGVLLMGYGELPSSTDSKRRVKTGKEVMKEFLEFVEEQDNNIPEEQSVNKARGPVATRGFFMCDFGRKEVRFLDLKSLGEGASPFAISKDGKTVFASVTITENDGMGAVKAIAELDIESGERHYLKLADYPASDIFLAEDEGVFFFSFANKKASEGKDYCVENIVKVEVTTGEVAAVTPPDDDRYLYAVAENARLLLAGEDSRDIWGAEKLMFCNYDGDVVRVVVESTTLLRYPYTRSISSNGERFLFAEWGKYLGILCLDEADKPDLYVLEHSELMNLTQDRLPWESYDISPNGLMAGIVIPYVDAGGYYRGQYLGVIDINTLELYRVMELPRNVSINIVSWCG
jgi:hypothetical protein